MGEQHRNQTIRDFVGVGPARTPIPTVGETIGGEACITYTRPVADQSQTTPGPEYGSGSGVATEKDLVYADPAPIADKDAQVYTIKWGNQEGNSVKTDVYEVGSGIAS